MNDLLTSRKFWALVVGLLVVLATHFVPNFHLDVEASVGFIVVLVGYMVGTAVDPGENAGTWQGIFQKSTTLTKLY